MDRFKRWPADDRPKPVIVYGMQPVMEAIESGREIDKILLHREGEHPQTAELFKLASAHGVPVAKVPQEKLNRITRKAHQGVIAFVSSVAFASLDHVVSECFNQGRQPLIVILDRITDVRNFGAIARAAECAGADALVIPAKGGAPTGPDAVKTSAGALQHLNICRSNSLYHTLRFLQNSGLTILACTEKAGKGLYSLELNTPLAVLMGSEEDGIDPGLLKTADLHASIPMEGKTGSLNVSVAAGIVLFEVNRQRRWKN